jgi:hypothetical protein
MFDSIAGITYTGGPGLAFETWDTSAHEGAEMVVGLSVFESQSSIVISVKRILRDETQVSKARPGPPAV